MPGADNLTMLHCRYFNTICTRSSTSSTKHTANPTRMKAHQRLQYQQQIDLRESGENAECRKRTRDAVLYFETEHERKTYRF